MSMPLVSYASAEEPSSEDYELTLFHQFPTRSTRVKWLAIELGIDDAITTRPLHLQHGEHMEDEYRQLNPMGAIPALVMEHEASGRRVTVTESSAICLLLTDMVSAAAAAESKAKSSLSPSSSLSSSPPTIATSGAGAAGKTPALKPALHNVFGMAQYHRMVALAAASIDPLLWAIREHEGLLPPEERVASVAARARSNFTEKVVPALEAVLLDGNVWACHPYHKGFTTADVMIGYSLFWASLYNLLDDSEPLQTYLGRIIERDAFIKAKNVEDHEPLPL